MTPDGPPNGSKMEPKWSQKVKMWRQGLKRGSRGAQMGSRRGFGKNGHPGISKKVIFWAPSKEPQLFKGTQKSNFGVQGSKNTAKVATFFPDVFEVAPKSGKVDKTM